MLKNWIENYYFVIHIRFEQVNTDLNQIWVAETDAKAYLDWKKWNSSDLQSSTALASLEAWTYV